MGQTPGKLGQTQAAFVHCSRLAAVNATVYKGNGPRPQAAARAAWGLNLPHDHRYPALPIVSKGGRNGFRPSVDLNCA